MRCPKCNGRGYLPEFHYVENGVCFLCGGNGNITKERLTLTKRECRESQDFNYTYKIPEHVPKKIKYKETLIKKGNFNELLEFIKSIHQDLPENGSKIYYLIQILPIENNEKCINWIDPNNPREIRSRKFKVRRWKCCHEGVFINNYDFDQHPEGTDAELWEIIRN